MANGPDFGSPLSINGIPVSDIIDDLARRGVVDFSALAASAETRREAVVPIKWGAQDPQERGPVIGTTDHHHNVAGAHLWGPLRALGRATGIIPADHKPDLTNTEPPFEIGPNSSWYDPKRIVSIDPWGASVQRVFATQLENGVDIRPTIAMARGVMSIPELQAPLLRGEIQVDGEIVLKSGGIKISKIAIDPVWHIPGIAERLGIDEKVLRRKLFEDTAVADLLLRPEREVFLPPMQGADVYIIGDPNKLKDPRTPITLRVHDACHGSDVFGYDICTCRPFLVYGIEQAVRDAQMGGLGIIAYFHKEGRGLGEVTKYLVYNARERQEGGDRAEMYMPRTVAVAGTEDVRFQTLMTDVLHWMGVKRIDKFVSESPLKHGAIERSGIEVVQRVQIPDPLIPPGATVEMGAKRGHLGYREGTVFVPSAQVRAEDPVQIMLSPYSVRERCHHLLRLAEEGVLSHFHFDPSRLDGAAQIVADEIASRYGTPDKIPYHSRWRNFEVSGRNQAEDLDLKLSGADKAEIARTKLDLVITSVILDAGSGGAWKYRDENAGELGRSEGLAVASLRMFMNGAFSARRHDLPRADLDGLCGFDTQTLASGLQVSSANPLAGLPGRAGLVRSLGEALRSHPELFGADDPRPGRIFDHLAARAVGNVIHAREIFGAVIDGLASIFPSGTTVNGVAVGDVWPHRALKTSTNGDPTNGLVPLHKLPQWLTYSTVEVLEQAGYKVTGLNSLTALGEYRNGGLLVDSGVLQLVDPKAADRTYSARDELMVEWRALTVAGIDRLADKLRQKLDVSPEDLPLAKVLEGGTWYAGRKLAAELRGGLPPIKLASDGTVM